MPLGLRTSTWEKNRDGVLMIDYSSQEPNFRKGKHANTLDEMKFKNFIFSTIDFSYDLMLEIKDKEKSANRARQILDQLSNLASKIGVTRNKSFMLDKSLVLFIS